MADYRENFYRPTNDPLQGTGFTVGNIEGESTLFVGDSIVTQQSCIPTITNQEELLSEEAFSQLHHSKRTPRRPRKFSNPQNAIAVSKESPDPGFSRPGYKMAGMSTEKNPVFQNLQIEKETKRPVSPEKLSQKDNSRLQPLREIDFTKEVDLTSLGEYISFLNDPRNIAHFANPPKTVEEFINRIEPNEHVILAKLNLKESQDKVVGGAVITEASRGQYDDFLRLLVIDPDIQRMGIGKEFLVKLVDYWLYTKQRPKLDLSIVRDIDGWENVRKLVAELEFDHISVLRGQVDVFIPGKNEMETHATERWETRRDIWRRARRKIRKHYHY